MNSIHISNELRKLTLFVFCEFPLNTNREFGGKTILELQTENYDNINEFKVEFPNKLMFEPTNKNKIERVIFLDLNILFHLDNYMNSCIDRGLTIKPNINDDVVMETITFINSFNLVK